MRTFSASVCLLGFVSLISARATQNLFGFGLNQIEPRDLSNSNGTHDDDITPKQSCSCGVRQGKKGDVEEDKIVGGMEAVVNEFPWRVNLQKKDMFGRSSFFCGGSVLSGKYILTAAHCTDGQTASKIYVDFGDHDLTTKSESQSELVQVKKIHQHSEYNKDTMDNDISILELVSTAAQINTKYVSPVCVPYKFEGEEFQGATVTASGWGTTREQGRTASKLQKVDLPVKTTKECNDILGYITENMICTYQEGKDTCQGDSGGSIDYKDPDTGKYHAIGVVSFGEGCARRNKPGVYAKTTNYLEYIDSIVGSGLCRA